VRLLLVSALRLHGEFGGHVRGAFVEGRSRKSLNCRRVEIVRPKFGISRFNSLTHSLWALASKRTTRD
jgi:hypothetical protein